MEVAARMSCIGDKVRRLHEFGNRCWFRHGQRSLAPFRLGNDPCAFDEDSRNVYKVAWVPCAGHSLTSGNWCSESLSDGSHYEKRSNGDLACIDDEIPFEIPGSWAWARMSALCDFGKCVNIDYSSVSPGTWNLDLEDLENDSGRILLRQGTSLWCENAEAWHG